MNSDNLIQHQIDYLKQQSKIPFRGGIVGALVAAFDAALISYEVIPPNEVASYVLACGITLAIGGLVWAGGLRIGAASYAAELEENQRLRRFAPAPVAE